MSDISLERTPNLSSQHEHYELPTEEFPELDGVQNYSARDVRKERMRRVRRIGATAFASAILAVSFVAPEKAQSAVDSAVEVFTGEEAAELQPASAE